MAVVQVFEIVQIVPITQTVLYIDTSDVKVWTIFWKWRMLLLLAYLGIYAEKVVRNMVEIKTLKVFIIFSLFSRLKELEKKRDELKQNYEHVQNELENILKMI